MNRFLLASLALILVSGCAPAKSPSCKNAENDLIKAYEDAKVANVALEATLRNPSISSKDIAYEFGKKSTAFSLKSQFLDNYCGIDALAEFKAENEEMAQEMLRTKGLRSAMGMGYDNDKW